MSITTYTELKSSIADFLNRDDLTAVIPSFIRLAEAQMNRDIRHWRMEGRATASFDTQFSEVPEDWVETIKMSVASSTGPQEVALISHAEMADLRQASNDRAGVPQFYAMSAGQFEFFPTPSPAVTGTLLYVAEIPALSDGSPTNWLLSKFPDAYLYGALVHSAPYLSDDQRTVVWGALYQAAVTAINTDSQRSKYSGTGLRLRVRGLS